jgi:hypothetical protein
MKFALVYDEVLPPELRRSMPADAGAEYEDAATIQGLLNDIAEGVRGPMRESIVPAWLDHLGIAYTGSDGLILAMALDKALAKQIVSDLGVNTPRFLRVRAPPGSPMMP